MKETGILRRIDELGRIVVPKEIRKKLKIREGDNLDIFVNEDSVILKKYSPLNDLEAILEILLDAVKLQYNFSMIVTDMEMVIASSKVGLEPEDILSESFIELITQNIQLEFNKNVPIEVNESFQTDQYIIIKPISVYGDLFGSIILFSDYDNLSNQQELIDLIHYFCSEYVQI